MPTLITCSLARLGVGYHSQICHKACTGPCSWVLSFLCICNISIVHSCRCFSLVCEVCQDCCALDASTSQCRKMPFAPWEVLLIAVQLVFRVSRIHECHWKLLHPSENPAPIASLLFETPPHFTHAPESCRYGRQGSSATLWLASASMTPTMTRGPPSAEPTF